MARSKRAAAGGPDLDERILDAALERAKTVGWDRLRLHDVAEQLGISLADVVAHYRDLDAVADAWFAKGWRAMLAPPPPGFGAQPAEERLHIMMMRWFDALVAHRRVTGEMLRTKLYPSHPHHWVPMIFNLSRTIQWLREVALLDAGGARRQVEEVGLTALFLATLGVWLRDESDGQERTRDWLRRRLASCDRAMVRLWGPANGKAARPPRGAAVRNHAATGERMQQPAVDIQNEVLEFWFAPGMEEKWFVKDAAFDDEVRRRLSAHYEEAAAGRTDAWRGTPRGCLALCILLDQVPRNLFRDGPKAYATDAAALAVARHAIAEGFDRALTQRERAFLYLPLEHSEDLGHQEHCVRLMRALDEDPRWCDFAERHRDVIARFGRFPHRNAALGRETSAEEAAFLQEPDSSF